MICIANEISVDDLVLYKWSHSYHHMQATIRFWLSQKILDGLILHDKLADVASAIFGGSSKKTASNKGTFESVEDFMQQLGAAGLRPANR